MSRFHSYLQTAEKIIDHYRGEQPLSSWLKSYFSQHKKHGSKDRKIISQLCFSYFRLGHSFSGWETGQKMLAALFLTTNQPDELLGFHKPEWNDRAGLSLEDKIKFAGYSVSPDAIFPWADELSNQVERVPFAWSHLDQPELFLRARPGMQSTVRKKLEGHGILFRETNDCFALDNSTPVGKLLDINREAVIQDYSSQQVGGLLKNILPNDDPLSIWDCCAGSGGKSILAKDILGNIDLTVTDIRKSILANLDKRFQEAGIKKYHQLEADLSAPLKFPSNKLFDLVIADLPCTGSGTWSRTPEQLYFFKKESIELFAELQRKIISNVVPHIKPGGYLLYITCSVFRKENEERVEDILKSYPMELVEMKMFKGYDKKADSLFAALFTLTT